MYKLILGGLLLVASASPASAMMASAGKTSGSDALDVSGSFAEQRQAIEKKLADGKTYSELEGKDRALVKEALGRISEALESSGGVAALSETQKAAVFNDQETINNILTRAGDDSRLICDRVAPVGSHRKVTSCLTVAERRRMRENTQDNMRKIQGAPQLKSN
jgi:hypothetical protein